MKKLFLIFILFCLSISVLGILNASAQMSTPTVMSTIVPDLPVLDQIDYIKWNYGTRSVGDVDCILLQITSEKPLIYFELNLDVTNNLSFNYLQILTPDSDVNSWTVNDIKGTERPGGKGVDSLNSASYNPYKVVYNNPSKPFTTAKLWIDFKINSYGDGYGKFIINDNNNGKSVSKLTLQEMAGGYGITSDGNRYRFKIADQQNTVILYDPTQSRGQNLRILSLDQNLPQTGFSSLKPQSLSNMPKNLNYQPLNVTIEIPSLDLYSEIVEVPNEDGEYKVTWLNDAVGLLEGSAIPGEGNTILVGHNHLNDTKNGPFIALSSLEKGTRLFILNADGNMKTYIVYANEAVAETDVEAVLNISEAYENSITMITCENEKMDGGYANRRVVAAKLMDE